LWFSYNTCPLENDNELPGQRVHRAGPEAAPENLIRKRADDAGRHSLKGVLTASNASGAFENRFPEEFGPALA